MNRQQAIDEGRTAAGLYGPLVSRLVTRDSPDPEGCFYCERGMCVQMVEAYGSEEDGMELVIHGPVS